MARLAVAVVVASRDRRELLLAGVARHLALPEAPEVCVVDDGSRDGTPAAVRARFPSVRVIERPAGARAAARTIGLRAVRAPYVALTDDDAWWQPGALAAAVALLDRHPRLALVNARVLVGPADREDPVCAAMARSSLPPAPGQPGRALVSFLACAVVVRRAAVLEAGGFSALLGIGGEEELLAWDLLAGGWQLSYAPDVVAHHHPPDHGSRPQRRARQLRNALWTAWLRRPARAAAARTVREVARGPADAATLRGVGSALTGAPRIVRRRRVVPPHVEAAVRLVERDARRRRSSVHESFTSP